MNSRRRFLKTSFAASLGIVACARSAPAAKPNVLFIFTDDQRFDTIAALGNPHISTPNLDRLAKRSFVFRNAYNFGGNSGAVCIPARNMAMTGKVFFRFDAGQRDKGLGPTFPKSMKAAGYETFYREKSGSANLPHIRKQFDHRKDVHMVNALRTGRAAKGIVDDAIAFVSAGRDKSKPFFMYLGFPCPHDPRWAGRKFRALYDPAELPLPPNYKPVHPWNIGDMTVRDECLEKWPRTEDAIRRHLHDYYSLISSMDFDIGRLLDTLDALSLTENTIVVFSSDQGLALGSHGLMGKQSVYEDVQKVPFLVSGPGAPKGESTALAYVHDIFPTVCDMAGVAVPKDIDGKSLAPVILGKLKKVRDRVMLAYKGSQRSIRDDRWKLIRFPQINRTQLFDLAADPREVHDLAADPVNADTVKRLMATLESEQKRYGDKTPLTAEKPKPADFKHPTKKLKTAYPAGGPAPGE
jgi:arylsulfatase A-like enzyme